MPDARHDLDTTPQALPLRSRLSLPALMSYLRTPSDQAQEWIESGWPKLTPAILVLLAPLAASGPIRAAFSLHLGVALGLGVLLTIALGAVFWPYLRAESAASRTRKSLLFEVVALAPAVYAI